jgi:hypothetical protein
MGVICSTDGRNEIFMHYIGRKHLLGECCEWKDAVKLDFNEKSMNG